MAKSSTKVVRLPVPTRAAPQVIKVSAPRAPQKQRKRSSRRSTGGGGITQQNLVNAGLGGAAFGMIEKMFPSLPTIPVLGKAGTVAIIAYLLKGKVAFAKDVGIAAAGLAGYQFVKEGHVLGGHVVPQVRGVAAQV